MRPLFLLLLFPAIGIYLAEFPGLNFDESLFFKQSFLGQPALEHAFVLPYAGALKQLFANIWFSMLDEGLPWSTRLIRAPWILVWTIGIAFHALAARRWLGGRGQLIFLLLIIINPDLSWCSRVDVGENSFAVLLQGIILLQMPSFTRVGFFASLAALSLGGWNRLNFYWSALPLLFLGTSTASRRRRNILLATGVATALFISWLNNTHRGGFLKLPWLNADPWAYARHFFHLLSGRAAAMTVFHGEMRDDALVIGTTAVTFLLPTWIWLGASNRKFRELLIRSCTGWIVVWLLYSTYRGIVGYWHIAYLYPLFFLVLTWTIETALRSKPWVGQGLLLVILLSTSSGWEAIRSNRRLDHLQTKFSTSVDELMSFCKTTHCIVGDVGIYENLLTSRPAHGVSPLIIQGTPSQAQRSQMVDLIHSNPDSWFVFWSQHRGDVPKNMPHFIQLWKELGWGIAQQQSIDNEAGQRVYILYLVKPP